MSEGTERMSIFTCTKESGSWNVKEAMSAYYGLDWGADERLHRFANTCHESGGGLVEGGPSTGKTQRTAAFKDL